MTGRISILPLRPVAAAACLVLASPILAFAQPAQQTTTCTDDRRALLLLLGLTALFIVLSTAGLAALAVVVRRSFWAKAADTPDADWRAFLMRLPLGAPEGSVRALLSIYVILFGLIVLVLQRRLGLDNVEAIAGFVGVVMTFYFTSRGSERSQQAATLAALHASNAAHTAHQVLRTVAERNAPVAGMPPDAPNGQCTQQGGIQP